MKLNFKYIIAAGLLVCMAGCDDKLETFEVVGSTAAPVAIAPSTVSSQALPGQINLSWEPVEGAYEYLKIKYYDPLQKKEIYLVASNGTSELLIDNTRARFGDYSFFFQTFNAANQGSAVTEIKAASGAAPAVYTEVSRAKVNLKVDQLSCNYPDASEGIFKYLIDGDTGSSSFFHTNWHSPQAPLPHYIQIDFNEEHENFAFEYYTRDTSNSDGYPTSAELQISNDGTNWETVSALSGLPAVRKTRYATEFMMPGKKFKHFRFNVTTSSQSKNYFHIGEIVFYDAEVDIYDPETVSLD